MNETPRNRPSHTREEPIFGKIDAVQDSANQYTRMYADVRPVRRRVSCGSGLWFWLLIALTGTGALVYINQDSLRQLLPNTELNALIARGNQALLQNKLIGTQGDSAYELFQTIRVLEPDNEQARAGLNQVGAHLLAQARSALQRKDYAAAHTLFASAQELLAGGIELEKFQLDLHAAEARTSESDTLLQRADAALGSGRLLGEGGAAVLYQQLLSVDGGNAVAQNGLQKVASALAVQTRDAITVGKLDVASQRINELMLLNPHHPDVPELRGQLAKALNDAQAVQMAVLQQTLARGEAELHAGHFSGDDSAAEAVFQGALKRDPVNARAKAGLRVVAQALVVQANAALDDNHTDIADNLLTHAEKLSPGDAELLAARRRLHEVQEQLDIASQHAVITLTQQNQIGELLRQANQALTNGNLILPPGDCAYDKFRAVLAIDGNNAQALQGLKRLPMRARELFEHDLRHNQLGKARIQLDALADSAPDDVGLAAMRRRLANAYLDQAEQRMTEGAPTEALRELKNAREVDPKNPRLSDVEQQLS